MLDDRRHTLRLHTTHVGCCHGSTEGGLLTTDVLGGASVEGDACEVDARAEDHVGTLGAELSPERRAIAVGEGHIPGCADGELRQAHGAADIKAGGAFVQTRGALVCGCRWVGLGGSEAPAVRQGVRACVSQRAPSTATT